MKKILCALITLTAACSLTGCFGNVLTEPSGGSSKDGATVVSTDNESKSEEQEEKAQMVNVGDKITTESMEVAINSIELTYDVLPDNISGFYTHYAAEAGKVYIAVDASVTNKAKQNLSCDDIGTIIADYNNGYTYRGFVVVKDANTGFTYANISSIDPLETKGIKWLVECPQEVEESSNPLFLEFTINGEKFKSVIR